MRAHQTNHFLILSLVVVFFTVPQQPTIGSASTKIQALIGEPTINPRRILHQPLFPESSPPVPEPPPLPPPPPPASPAFPNPDQPFFPEQPNGPTLEQAQPPPVSANGTAVANPIATQPTKPTKKVAIAISVGIVTLGMLSALAFYLYKHSVKHPDDSQKLVGGTSQRFQDESRVPPSTFLYIGTVEPSQTSISEANGPNGSPYRKLSSVKRSDRYRPSPDLQPLPKLPKPPLPTVNSPPPMSSSDEESQETAFYTPQCSLVSNDEGSYQSYTSKNTSSVTPAKVEAQTTTSSVPFSKRTSPKSRLSGSSPEMKRAIIPSVKQPLPPPPPPPPPPLAPHSQPLPQPTFSYSQKRPKFSSPPPPPDMVRLQSITSQAVQTSKIPAPPPPPPAPPLSTPRKLRGSETTVPSKLSQELRTSQSRIPNSKPNSQVEETKIVEEINKGTGSSERADADDADGTRPKLKPLHWDKVRATSDRAMVWDQL